jgi:hypothetical protein
VQCPCPTSYECLFLPLLGSHLSFPLVIYTAFSYLLLVLFFFVHCNLVALFRLILIFYLSEPSLLCPALWGNVGRLSLIGHERRARDGIDAVSTVPKSINSSNLELRDDTMVLSASSSSTSCVSPLSHVQPLSCHAKPVKSAYLL